MKYFKQYFAPIFVSAGIIISYLFLRLTNLMSLPIFTDEAIYTRWSQIARYDASWRFISLTDGKQPMFVWWDMVFMHLIQDPLLAGRLVSVVCGVLTMVGLFFLGREIFKNKWVGIISAALYMLFPFALVYDRMAMYDTMVGTFTVWSLYFEILLVRNPRAWVGFTLALALGAGMLTKTSAFFSWYLLPCTLLLFDWSKKDRLVRLGKFIGFSTLAIVLGNVYYGILRLSPFYHIINDKDGVFVYPISKWIQHPFTYFFGNIHGLWSWFSAYFTYPVLFLVIAAFFVVHKYWREKVLLILYCFVPFILLALFGRVLYPRFILFMTLNLLPVVALFVVWAYGHVKNIWMWLLFIVVFFTLWARSDYYILTNFAIAPIADSDLAQYMNDWAAGGGIKETIAYLSQQAKTKKIFVASEGTFGSLPTLSVQIYLGRDKNVSEEGIWPIPSQIPQNLQEKAKTMDTYMIFYQQKAPPLWPLQLIAKYRKGIGHAYLRLYKVKPL